MEEKNKKARSLPRAWYHAAPLVIPSSNGSCRTQFADCRLSCAYAYMRDINWNVSSSGHTWPTLFSWSRTVQKTSIYYIAYIGIRVVIRVVVICINNRPVVAKVCAINSWVVACHILKQQTLDYWLLGVKVATPHHVRSTFYIALTLNSFNAGFSKSMPINSISKN